MPSVTDYEIHISDVGAYKKCRRMWNWSSPLRGNLEPFDKYAPFFVGSMVHHALEYWYKFNTPPVASVFSYAAKNCSTTEIDDPNIREQINLAVDLVNHYLLWQAKDQSILADANFEFIAPEQSFKTILWRNSRKRIWLAGTFDGVVKQLSSGKYYLWEIKTTRSLIEREKQLALDEQTTAYANAAQTVVGYDISGIVYTLIKKKVPEFPKVNNDGQLSQSKSQDTTPEFYLDCIKRNHPNITKEQIKTIYGNFINYLCQEPSKYFRRLVVNRSAMELHRDKLELIAAAQEMVDNRTPIFRSGGPHCNYCLFRSPCIALNAGRDYQSILAEGYTKNRKYVDEVTE